MSYSLQNTTSLASLADAIRAKSGETANMTVEEMIAAVNSISTGSGSGYMKRKEFYETSQTDGVAGEIIHGSYVDVDTGLPEGSEFLFIFTTPTFSGTSSGTENAVAYVAYYDGNNFHRLNGSKNSYIITHTIGTSYPITFEVNYDSTTGTNILRINNNGSSYYYDLNLGKGGYDASNPVRYVWGNLFYLENFATKKLVFSRANGDYSNAFAGYNYSKNEIGALFDTFADAISIENAKDCSYMFQNISKATRFPTINITTATGNTVQCGSMFSHCEAMENPPTLVFANPKVKVNSYCMFEHCYNLTEIPDDYLDDWADDSSISGAFPFCCRLSKMPDISRFRYNEGNYSSIFINTALEEIVNFPVYAGTLTSNVFSLSSDSLGYVAIGCGKLREFTFATNNGTPYVVQWKNQVIKMGNTWVGGWSSGRWPADIYPASKGVSDDTSYAALKNTDDWYATDMKYSRYNHDSMVRTLNSLPDASAYLATAGGTNTIQFWSNTASNTDEGGVSNLTPEEIAVATAKGWTVSY